MFLQHVKEGDPTLTKVEPNAVIEAQPSQAFGKRLELDGAQKGEKLVVRSIRVVGLESGPVIVLGHQSFTVTFKQGTFRP